MERPQRSVGSACDTRFASGQGALPNIAPNSSVDRRRVATATGLARPTVSTTLSRLSRTGAVVKADRGYRLPSTNDGTGISPHAGGR
jgi:hypothetical protein